MQYWSILLLLIAFSSAWHEKAYSRWEGRTKEAAENHKSPPPLFPKWRFLSNLATEERKGKVMLFFFDEELLKNKEFLPYRYVSVPSYFYEPVEVQVNSLDDLDGVDLVYTEDHSYELLKERMKGLGKWSDFRIVQRYGDYQLLERTPK